MADDSRYAGIVDQVTRVVRSVGPSCTCAGIGKSRFSGSRITTKENALAIPANTAGMKIGDDGSSKQEIDHFFDKVVTKVETALQRTLVEPDKVSASS